MTLVLEESEDISLELLTPLLSVVKNNEVIFFDFFVYYYISLSFFPNVTLVVVLLFQEVLPIGRRLGERVFEICAHKLRPCLLEAVKSLEISLDDYSKVVASVCEGTTAAVEHNDDNTNVEQPVRPFDLKMPFF